MAKNIFVLEDNDDIRDIVSIILEGDEYKVTAFPDIKTFKDGLKWQLPDIFILDVMLPDGTGFEVCSELKLDERTRNVPIVMMSANFHLSQLAELCQPDDFINKPFDIDDFKSRIDRQFTVN